MHTSNTDHDETLDKAVWHILAEQMTHIINCEDPKHRKAMSCVAFTAGAHVEMMQLILQDRERAVLTAQIGMVEYYYQVSNNKDMDWKGLFADNRKALEYDLSKLQSPNKREDSDE